MLKNDIGYAFGRIFNEPFASLLIVLTLALGIGASSAIFSVVNGVLIKAAPFSDAKRLVTLRQSQPKQGDAPLGLSALELADYRQQSELLETVSEYHNMTFTMYGHGLPKRVNTGVVSANHFPMLGIRTLHGRLFNPDEDQMGARPLVLLTYEYWQKEFGADQAVVGKTVELNNRAHEIIGVLQPFPQFPDVNDIYMALPSCPWRSGTAALENRNTRFLQGFAKLKETVSLAQAQQELATIASRVSQHFPEDYPAAQGFSASASLLVDDLVQGSETYLMILLATTVLVLLIASANVTNLILSQHARRNREFAVRSALGATRLMLARQLLVEGTLLALLGGMLGLLFAYVGVELLRGFAEHFSTRANQIVIDGNVIGFTLVVSMVTGLVAGLSPSFTKRNLLVALKEGGKASHSTSASLARNSLLVMQFSLSLTLLVCATLSITSLNSIKAVESGYQPGDVKVIQLDLNWSSYNSAETQWQVTQELISAFEDLNYVSKVVASQSYPLDVVMAGNNQIRSSVMFDDRTFDENSALINTFQRPISPGYFELLKIELLDGRAFTNHDDTEGEAVVIVNESLASQYWPEETAVGHKVSFDAGQSWLKIIAVVADVTETSLDSNGDNQIYFPLAQSPSSHVVLLMNVADGVEAFRRDVPRIVNNVDSQQAISKIESLQLARNNSLSLQVFVAQLLTIFAAIAVFITVSGVGGVLAYLVKIRTREIGIRMSLGADARSILLMILLYGLKLSFIGLLLGLGLAWWMANLMNDYLFEVTSSEPLVYLYSISVMLVVGILASLIPSYFASKMDPIQALRNR